MVTQRSPFFSYIHKGLRLVFHLQYFSSFYKILWMAFSKSLINDISVAGYRKCVAGFANIILQKPPGRALLASFPRATVFKAGSGLLVVITLLALLLSQLWINSPLCSNTCFPETLFLSVGEERRGLINQLLIVLCWKPCIVPVNCYPFSFSAGIFLSKILR